MLAVMGLPPFGLFVSEIMIFGALFLVDGPIPEMRVHLFTALLVSVPIGLIAVFLTTLVIRARRNPDGAQSNLAKFPLSPIVAFVKRGELP